jgi:uncharacterized membrane protein YoaK (UPF0700 family)
MAPAQGPSAAAEEVARDEEVASGASSVSIEDEPKPEPKPKPAGRFSTKFWLSVGFAFVSGWINAVSLYRYQAFGNMMVGNMVYFSLHIVKRVFNSSTGTGDNSAWEMLMIATTDRFYGWIILFFVLGVMLHAVLVRYKRVSGAIFAPIIAISIAMFDVGWRSSSYHKHWLFILAPVFGFLNCMARTGIIGRMPYALTGDIMTMGSTLVAILSCTASEEDKKQFVLTFGMMASMLLGGSCATVLSVLTQVSAKHDSFEFELAVISPLVGFLLFMNAPIRKP